MYDVPSDINTLLLCCVDIACSDELGLVLEPCAMYSFGASTDFDCRVNVLSGT